MKNIILRILFIFFIFLLIPYTLYCQLRFQYEDVQVHNNGDIIVTVFAQNVGSRQYLTIPYGYMWKMQGTRSLEKTINIRYHHIPSRTTKIEIPSSVTINTIFSGQIEMGISYEMPSTGTQGQTWNIIFTDIPIESDKAVISIFGWEYEIGDLPLARIARIEISKKVQEAIHSGDKYFKLKDYKNAIIEYTGAIILDDSFLRKLSTKVASGFYNLSIIDFDKGDYKSALENYEMSLNADSTYWNRFRSTLGTGFYGLALKELNNKNYETALGFYDYCLKIDKSLEKELSNKFGSKFYKTAEHEYDNGNYNSAIKFYELSLDMDKSYTGKIANNYSNAVYNIATERFSENDFISSSSLYKKAIEIDNDIYNKVNKRFQDIRKNSKLIGASSIIPGIGQLINKDIKKARTYFAIFATTLASGIISKNIADNKYNEYLESTTTNEADALYREASIYLNVSNGLLGGAIATVYYSISNAYRDAEKFNELFMLNDLKYRIGIVPNLGRETIQLTFLVIF